MKKNYFTGREGNWIFLSSRQSYFCLAIYDALAGNQLTPRFSLYWLLAESPQQPFLNSPSGERKITQRSIWFSAEPGTKSPISNTNTWYRETSLPGCNNHSMKPFLRSQILSCFFGNLKLWGTTGFCDETMKATASHSLTPRLNNYNEATRKHEKWYWVTFLSLTSGVFCNQEACAQW